CMTWGEYDKNGLQKDLCIPFGVVKHRGILKQGSIKHKSTVRILIPWLLCAIYAASDELHQTFVQGRSGQVSDVCLDSIGALVGVVIGLFILYRVENVYST
nr:VanZ family protein [Lachnospiraceae bacterium]